MPSTILLHRVVATSPDKLYRAFIEPDAGASWLPPYGFLCTVHELNVVEGGEHRMSSRNFTTGRGTHSVVPIWLKPGERLVYTDGFDDPNLPAEMTVTVSLKSVSVGTEINIEQKDIPDLTPPKLAIMD